MLEVEVRQLVQRHEKELAAKDAAIQLISQKVHSAFHVTKLNIKRISMKVMEAFKRLSTVEHACLTNTRSLIF